MIVNVKEVEELKVAGRGKYDGFDNNRKPKSEYLDKLVSKDDDKLFEETKNKIWLSAFASNNPRSDYHWHCDATYDEWQRRKGSTEMYSKAHKEVSRSI